MNDRGICFSFLQTDFEIIKYVLLLVLVINKLQILVLYTQEASKPLKHVVSQHRMVQSRLNWINWI